MYLTVTYRAALVSRGGWRVPPCKPLTPLRQPLANAAIAASRGSREQTALSLVMVITKWSIEIHKFGAPLNGQIVRPTDGQDVRSHPIRTEERLQ